MQTTERKHKTHTGNAIKLDSFQEWRGRAEMIDESLRLQQPELTKSWVTLSNLDTFDPYAVGNHTKTVVPII